MILSMALYYVVCNPNLPFGLLRQENPLFSLPFLLLFAVFCWYRLSFAIALLPLSLPFYLYQKTVIGHMRFSLAEVALWTIIGVVLLRLLVRPEERQLWLSRAAWREKAERIGPFLLPVLVFVLAAALSISVAYARAPALRAFREEVFGPLLYLLLALTYLRSQQDVKRLLAALFGTGLVIALLGIVQYVFFRHSLALEVDGIRRVHTVYGSANSIGLLFDYVLPPGLAILSGYISWKKRLAAFVFCIPLLVTLYLSNSRGAWAALVCALVFVVACSVRSRKMLFIGGGLLAVVLAAGSLLFQAQIMGYLLNSHTNAHGYSSVEKRTYIWQSALNMIHDSPWLGYGMDNWLCHYSPNNVCKTDLPHYWITEDPVTGKPTGIADEPNISHPHNIFLHVWVSMGVFGLLAFGVVLILFFWLFVRILLYLRRYRGEGWRSLHWMTVGVGGAMLAVLVQGQIDSAFLEQDLAFCFWMLVAALLLLRVLAGVPWRASSSAHQSKSL